VPELLAPDYGETPELLATRNAVRRKRAAYIRVPDLNRLRRERELHDAYIELFYVDGVIRKAAQIVLDDLADSAALGKAAGGVEHEELLLLEGKRRLLFHILAFFKRPND
jgi:hypothetical protein